MFGRKTTCSTLYLVLEADSKNWNNDRQKWLELECSLAMKQRRLSWFVRAPCPQSVVSWFFLWCPNPPCWWWTGEKRLLCWSLSALLKLSYMRNPCKRTTFRVCETACKFWLLRDKMSPEGPWFVVRSCLGSMSLLQHSDVLNAPAHWKSYRW